MSFFNTQGMGNALSSSFLDFGLGSLSGLISKGYQKDLMDYQNKINKDFNSWQAQTLPAMQIQGLKTAGISPAAMNGFSPPSTSMQSVPSSPSTFGNHIDLSQNSMFASQADANKATAEKELALAENTKVQTAIDVAKLPHQERLVLSEIMKNESQSDLNRSGSKLYDTQSLLNHAKFNEVLATTDKIISDTNLNYYVKQKYKAEVKHLLSSIRNLDAQTNRIYALLPEEQKKLQTEVFKLAAEGKLTAAQNALKKHGYDVGGFVDSIRWMVSHDKHLFYNVLTNLGRNASNGILGLITSLAKGYEIYKQDGSTGVQDYDEIFKYELGNPTGNK